MAICVLMGALTSLRLPTLPYHPAHPPLFPPTHPLIHAIHVITVAVKKAAENPAVLAI